MNERIKSLIRDYADGQITADQLPELEQALRADAAVREQFLHELNIQAALEDAAIGECGSTITNDGGERRVRFGEANTLVRASKASVSNGFLAFAVVAVLVLIAGVYFLRSRGESEIVTISRLNGSLKWIGNGGQVTDELVAGERLPGGTLELLSADSWVEFQFRDRSTVTLSGQSAITISERQQKELHLRHGSLSASVQPQPIDRPMLVHTQAAELQVLGTQFNVDAQAEATRLTVNEGRVRLKRVTDGKWVDVPAEHAVTASIEDQNGLALSRRGASVATWKSDLMSDVVHGKWVSHLWMLGVRLKKAVAEGEMTKEDAIAAYKDAATLDDEKGSVWAKPWPLGSMVLLSVSRSSPTPVVLTSGGKLRIRGRLHLPVEVEFGITTNKPNGGFAGKYSVSVSADAMQGDDNAFDIELPLSQFREDTRFGDSPIGKELSDWWCVTKTRSTKLEITGVELVE